MRNLISEFKGYPQPKSIFIRLFYVEQAPHHMNQPGFIKIQMLFVIALLFGLIGCKSEDPNPELKDQLYLQLQKEEKVLEKAQEEAVKTREETLKEMLSPKLDRVDKIRLARQLKKAEIALLKVNQDFQYIKIKVARRKVETRKSYKVAFLADKDWNTADEFKNYETHQRLVATDLNWDKRVPKLFQNSPNFQSKKKEKPKSGGGEH